MGSKVSLVSVIQFNSGAMRVNFGGSVGFLVAVVGSKCSSGV